MTDRKLVLVAAIAVALAVPATAALAQGLSGPEPDESLADWTGRWLDGPVGAIATRDERETYDSLDTTQERLQFIRLFWQRRDPQLRGPTNEYLDEFRARVDFANLHFSYGEEPGWKTLFGRVVLVYGPPQGTVQEPFGPGDRPAVRWVYDRSLPGIAPKQDLLFVSLMNRWRLMPPYSRPEMRFDRSRQGLERGLVGRSVEIPSDYRDSMEEEIEGTLVNSVDYRAAMSSVRAAVVLPEAQIPFSWSARFGNTSRGRVAVTIDITWRMDSLVFHQVDDAFETDLLLDAQLLDDAGEPIASSSDSVVVSVPAAEIEARRTDIVQRQIELEAPPGDYVLQLTLLDQLLGYRTAYREELSVPGS